MTFCFFCSSRQNWQERKGLLVDNVFLFFFVSFSPFIARLFDYFDSGVMEGLQHRLLELAKSRTQGRLAETPGDSMALTSQVSRILNKKYIYTYSC